VSLDSKGLEKYGEAVILMLMKKLIAFALLTASFSALDMATANAAASNESALGGPALHATLGVRNRKAPYLDELYSGYGGLKASLFSYAVNDDSYISFVGLGVYIQRNYILAFGISPFIFNHASGIGIGFDFLATHSERAGGPVGLSLNVDLMKAAKYFHLN
jgi:hypothetical protein